MDEAVIQGYEAQNKYYSLKWNWTGGVASEPNAEPTVGSTERAGVWKWEFCTAEPSCFRRSESAAAVFAELTCRTLPYSEKSWK